MIIKRYKLTKVQVQVLPKNIMQPSLNLQPINSLGVQLTNVIHRKGVNLKGPGDVEVINEALS